MLNTLNLYSAIGQSYLNKTGNHQRATQKKAAFRISYEDSYNY